VSAIRGGIGKTFVEAEYLHCRISSIGASEVHPV
jgi:hypothetical protein